MFVKMRKKPFLTFSLQVLGLVVINLFAVAIINADRLNADLKVCVQSDDGKPIKNATVQLKGGKTEVKLNPDSEGCYYHKGISFDSTKQYSLEITADRYQSKIQLLDTAQFKPNTEPTLNPIVLALLLGQSNASPEPSPMGPSPTPLATNNTASSGWWEFIVAGILIGLLFITAGGLAVLWRSSSRLTAMADALSRIEQTSSVTPDVSKIVTGAMERVELAGSLIREHQMAQVKVLSEIREIVAKLPTYQNANEQSGLTNSKAPAVTDLLTPDTPQLSDREASIVSYEHFLRGEAVFPGPLYLSDVGGSSMTDALGGRSILLEENVQGAIVLLRNREGDKKGWVYPNTIYHYREAELKSVFAVTNEQFNCLKTKKSLIGCNVEPVPVKQIPDSGKWQVEIGRE